MGILKTASKIKNVKVIDLGNYVLLGGYLHEANNLNPLFGVIYDQYDRVNTVLNSLAEMIGARCSNDDAISFTTHFLVDGFKPIYEYDAINNKIKFVLYNNSDSTQIQYITIDLNSYTLGKEYDQTLPWSTTNAPYYLFKFKKGALYYTSNSYVYINGRFKIPTSYTIDDLKVVLDEVDKLGICVYNNGLKTIELYIFDQSNVLRRVVSDNTGLANMKVLTSQFIPTGNPNEYRFYLFRVDTTNKTPILKKGVLTIDGSTTPTVTYTTYTVNDGTGTFNFASIVGTGTWNKVVDCIYHTDGTNEYLIVLVEKRRFASTDASTFYGILVFLLDETTSTATLVAHEPNVIAINHIPYSQDLTEWIVHSTTGIDYISINFAGNTTSINKNNILSSGKVHSVMVDTFNRIWYYDGTSDEINIILPTAPVKAEMRLQDNVRYAGQPINTNLIVNLWDMRGNRLSKQVNLVITSGNAYFTNNNSNSITITTDALQDTLVPITITNGGVVNIILSYV